jgi:hypothetical protein
MTASGEIYTHADQPYLESLRIAFRDRVNNHYFPGIVDTYEGTHYDLRANDYKDNQLVRTNNLRLYITDDPVRAITKGYPDLASPVQKRAGEIIRDLKDRDPELWQRATSAAIVNNEQAQYENDKLDALLGNTSINIQEALDSVKPLLLQRETVLTEVFDALVPYLAADNIDPITICI